MPQVSGNMRASSSLVAAAITLDAACYAKLNSKYVSVLHHKNGIRAAQYLRLMACRARACSAGGKMLAVASNSAPVTVPRIVHGATRTFGLFRIRFVFPMSLRVIT